MSFGYGGPLATAVFVAGAFNSLLVKAKEKSDSSRDEFANAQSVIDGHPETPESDSVLLNGLGVQATRYAAAGNQITGAAARHLQGLDARDQAGANGQVYAFERKLVDDISDFFDTYFPNAAAVNTRALRETQDAIRHGGTTIRRSIETVAFQKARDTALREANEEEKKLMARYAGRGYNKPSGALVGQVAAVWRDAQRKIAEASTALALEQFGREAEAVRRYVDLAAKTRGRAMDQFGAYMTRMVALRFEQLTMEASEENRFRVLLRDSYLADQSAAAEATAWTDKLCKTQFELDYAAATEPDELKLKQLHKKVEKAISEAERLSTIAATAFNGLQGNAAVSGTETD